MQIHNRDSGHSGHSPSESSIELGFYKSSGDIWAAHKLEEQCIQENRGMLPDECSGEDLIRIMTEGVEDVKGVVARLYLNQGQFGVLDLDDMNIRGKQIWIGYRDVCEGNFEKFVDMVRNRNSDFVTRINHIAEEQQIPHVAVTSGGTLRQRISPRAR